MKIEVWSDFVCPFCYIGKKNLETALLDLPGVEVIYRSYELDPKAPSGRDMKGGVLDMMAKKYNVPLEDARAGLDSIVHMAKEAGLDYDYSKWRMANTFTIHRLAHFALEKGLGAEFTEAGLHASFITGACLDDEQTLIDLAVSVGLDAQETRAVIHSDQYSQAVRADESKAAELGARGVPFFMIEGKRPVFGAQSAGVFKDMLLGESRRLTELKTGSF